MRRMVTRRRCVWRDGEGNEEVGGVWHDGEGNEEEGGVCGVMLLLLLLGWLRWWGGAWRAGRRAGRRPAPGTPGPSPSSCCPPSCCGLVFEYGFQLWLAMGMSQWWLGGEGYEWRLGWCCPVILPPPPPPLPPLLPPLTAPPPVHCTDRPSYNSSWPFARVSVPTMLLRGAGRAVCGGLMRCDHPSWLVGRSLRCAHPSCRTCD